MFETFPKSGKKGKAVGYRSFISKSTKNEDTEFYEAQGTLAKAPDNERVDLYGKPGTDAFKRQADSFETSYPTSRYRSKRP